MSQLTCSQLSQAESDNGIIEYATPLDCSIQNDKCQAPQKADYQVLRNQNFTPPARAPAQSPPPLGQRMSFLSTTSSGNNASNTIIELPSQNVHLTQSQTQDLTPSQRPCDDPTSCENSNSSFSRQQDGLFSSNQSDIPREQNATGYETNPVVQNENLETTRPSPSQEPTVEPAISDLQRNQTVQRWLRRSNLSALNRTSRVTRRAFRGSRKRRRKPKKRTKNNNSVISSVINSFTTAHGAYAGMPRLQEREDSSDDEDSLIFSDSESDADSNDTNLNTKMPAQPSRNEKENMDEIGNGGGDFDGDDDDRSFLIQDAIEHNMDQISQEDDHAMPSDEENETSVAPLRRNDDEKTINDCFDKIENGVRPRTRFHEHPKVNKNNYAYTFCTLHISNYIILTHYVSISILSSKGNRVKRKVCGSKICDENVLLQLLQRTLVLEEMWKSQPT